MPIAGLNIPLDSTEGMDKITSTEKVTTPYFAGGYTELTASNITTSSLSDTNETYFYGISNSNTVTTEEFNIAFGSTNGYGAVTAANKKNVNDAIYKHYASLLLTPTEVTGGFFISSKGSSGAISTGKDSEIYVLTARRSNMKDRLNKGNWTIALSGSGTATANLGPGGVDILSLTDDSVNNNPTATPAGDRYNIVSGALGVNITGQEASVKTYGHYYSDMGVLVFSATELSASIPGSGSQAGSTVQFSPTGRVSTNIGDQFRGFGFPTNASDTVDRKVALRFVNCLKPLGGKLSFRDEEDQVSAQYFCRVRSGQSNFSNNPTFVSGSNNELRNSKMRGNPQTFISSVQLYNPNGDMVAVGNLSTPLKKNFSSEATIKVKLTY
tara:strand:- start:545 stop:1693 length:1149 start_codon:yes stop_codon:yes gene_type:complete